MVQHAQKAGRLVGLSGKRAAGNEQFAAAQGLPRRKPQKRICFILIGQGKQHIPAPHGTDVPFTDPRGGPLRTAQQNLFPCRRRAQRSGRRHDEAAKGAPGADQAKPRKQRRRDNRFLHFRIPAGTERRSAPGPRGACFSADSARRFQTGPCRAFRIRPGPSEGRWWRG